MSKSPSSSSSPSDSVSSTSTIKCFFDASTCQRQSFSVPEKIVYYIAKNVTNVKTYQKLVQICKHFFKVNPVIIVPKIDCYGDEWYACYGVKWEYRVRFKYDQPINFKIWVTESFACLSGDASKMIPLIYKNFATFFLFSLSVFAIMKPLQDSSSESHSEIKSSMSKSSSSSSSSSSSPSDSISSTSTVKCFFDSTTCQRQNFSIPEKIVYYIAKNCTNGETFKKLVETCKYFFKVNPVVVVPQIKCYDHEWVACYDWKYRVGFKYDQPIKFKIWVTQKFDYFFGNASQMIPWIYKNDAMDVNLGGEPLKFEEFLIFACNAVKLSMVEQLVKNENGETVQLEDIVKDLLKLKTFEYLSNDGSDDVNCNTVRKLMEIEHFKNISRLEMDDISETLNVEEMFNLILENKHIEVDLWYRRDISDECKELIREYSNLLKNEERCNSVIKHELMDNNDTGFLTTSSSEDYIFNNFDDNVSTYENEDLMFPWNTEDDEEWELPWDKKE